ncbi:MAG: type II toxin-antitoxin system VapC family toxin [Chloroflexi bacterium]|nr:type II toxin-antitoxin system VapC family toxin [Chloroflexota bacterium]
MVKEVAASVPLQALDFVENNHLKPRDAFHVAIMRHFGISEIVSDDRDFDKVPG